MFRRKAKAAIPPRVNELTRYGEKVEGWDSLQRILRSCSELNQTSEVKNFTQQLTKLCELYETWYDCIYDGKNTTIPKKDGHAEKTLSLTLEQLIKYAHRRSHQRISIRKRTESAPVWESIKDILKEFSQTLEVTIKQATHFRAAVIRSEQYQYITLLETMPGLVGIAYANTQAILAMVKEIQDVSEEDFDARCGCFTRTPQEPYVYLNDAMTILGTQLSDYQVLLTKYRQHLTLGQEANEIAQRTIGPCLTQINRNNQQLNNIQENISRISRIAIITNIAFNELENLLRLLKIHRAHLTQLKNDLTFMLQKKLSVHIGNSDSRLFRTTMV